MIIEIFKQKIEEKHNKFIAELQNQSDEYLFNAWSSLDMDLMEGAGNKYTQLKYNAVEEKLNKRGYVNDMGQVIPPTTNMLPY